MNANESHPDVTSRPCATTMHAVFIALLACMPCTQAAAVEDIEFVAEHLAEVPMDNRFATLPVWDSREEITPSWSFVGQAAYSDTTSGNLNIAGPLFSVAAMRALNRRWSLGVFAFFDALTLSGDHDVRPLQTLFSPGTPFARPVSAQFGDLDGSMHHYGGGLRFSLSPGNMRLGKLHWIGGLMWQRVELRDYRLGYLLLEGEAAGASGQIDFDANYTHVTPFIGLEWPRVGAVWAISPHALAAWPNPRYGVAGHITGEGFDLRGDTETSGNGVHFGDPSLTFGLDVTYLPTNLSVDLGALLTQRLFEPIVHKGIEANWLISFQWRF